VVAATLLALGLVVVLPAAGLTTLLRAVTIAALVLFAGRVIRPADVFELINLRIVALIAAAIGLGRAVEVSGLAEEVADGIVRVTEGGGEFLEVLGVLLVVMILTELVTNVAAVALAFPTALEIAARADLDPKRMAVGVAVAASASFLTPIGYQTNTMVWGPGRYHFTDYLRLGFPLWLIAWFGIAAGVVWL
jgi:di/tricarboxylate transporter